MKYRDEDIDKCIDEFLKNVKDRFKTNLSSTTQNSRIKKCQSAKKSFDNTIKIWEINSLNCVQTLEGHTSNVINVIKLKMYQI